MPNDYNAKSIQVLEGLDAVRKRPGMYIGSTDSFGLHHLIWEILDNSIDEAMNGYGKKITLTVHQDNSISIQDNGRGIPIDLHPKLKKSAIEVIFTTLHSGGKFDNHSYKSSGGLHGVGSSVVNALSSKLIATINQKKGTYQISFNNGIVAEKLKRIGPKKPHTGTLIHFWPNLAIFQAKHWDVSLINKTLQEKSFLNAGLTLELIDEQNNKTETFISKNGILDMIEYFTLGEKQLIKPIAFFAKNEDFQASIAFTFLHDSDDEQIHTYANNVKTVSGGTHEIGFKTGLTKAISEFAKKQNHNIKYSFDGRDIREGIVAVVSVKVTEKFIQYEGQTKAKLSTPEIRSFVESLLVEKMKYYLVENRLNSDKILKKIVESAKLRAELKKQREVSKLKAKRSNQQKLFIGKLVPCHSKNPQKSELFLVEGDSAGGSAKQGRDSKYQAILPLKGKIINTFKSRLINILKNDEIITIINAIGAGISQDFIVEKIKYNRIIIMTDADVDGAHIQTLLLTFFFKYMRPLIMHGHLYIAKPPLFKITNKRSKEVIYLHNESEYHEFCKLKNIQTMNTNNYSIQRYKGLGEMNADQLWETTMNYEKRQLIKVTIEDENLCFNMVKTLMGKNIEKKKEWLDQNIDFSFLDNGFI